ncbi:MAG: L,D-transpeptidase, partial [Chloroflexota bacterium]
WYDVGGGNWLRQTQVSLVDPHPRPLGVGPHEFWVEVDLYEQSFAAYEGDRMVYAGLVSSGLNRWPTHEGLFQVWSRHLEVKMSGAEGKEDYYFIEDVPHTMFFDEDIALHGAYWHDWFGFKHSHGCVNMPPRDAEWVYNWSAVAPNDLWVWVHESDPADYFHQYEAGIRGLGD